MALSAVHRSAATAHTGSRENPVALLDDSPVRTTSVSAATAQRPAKQKENFGGADNEIEVLTVVPPPSLPNTSSARSLPKSVQAGRKRPAQDLILLDDDDEDGDVVPVRENNRPRPNRQPVSHSLPENFEEEDEEVSPHLVLVNDTGSQRRPRPWRAHTMDPRITAAAAAAASASAALGDEEALVSELGSPAVWGMTPAIRGRGRAYARRHRHASSHQSWRRGPAPIHHESVGPPHAYSYFTPTFHHYHHLGMGMGVGGGAGPAEEASYEQLLALDDKIKRKGVTGSALESRSFTQTLQASDAEILNARGVCVICLDEYEAGQRVRRLPCLCTFHCGCIDRHLRDNTLCPICRMDVNA